MSQVPKDVAILKLTTEIAKFSWDDVVETHNELFPFQPLSVDDEPANTDEVRRKVLAHVAEGLEAEEIIDLWNVVFPADRNVWYDDELACVHFNEEPQQVESSD